MLRKIDQDIWVAEQPLRYFGLNVGTRMTVIRLSNSELVVISPIQASDTLIQQLSELGKVKHIIAPNLYHYLFAAEFKQLYAKATFWTVPGLERKQPELAIDQIIEGNTKNLWPGLDCLSFSGFRTLSLNGFDSLNEYVFLHIASRTLILTDAAFNFDESFPIATRLITQVIGGYKRLSPSLLEKFATTDKAKVRQSVEQILTWDFERVIVAHGSIVEQGGKEKFNQGYKRFLRRF
ncbi:MAG: DUF4336 domain-containing protein [Leptolyngbyaceae cyanobacterium MAG.088]|nr:DUF4336 domain-containing protein [Leptolyngbyaceae cyanobacterium MAG.088]